MGFTFIAGVLLVSILLFLYFRLSLRPSTTVLSAEMVLWTLYGDGGSVAIVSAWLLFLIPAVPLNITSLRRRLVSNRVLAIFRKLMPPISRTEREALEAGDVWWEGELFGGYPDWKKLRGYRKTALTDEERAFLDGPAEELCGMLNDWEITDNLHDLPPSVWSFIKENRFFGMIIPKEYGGLGFSARAHADVVQKIGSRSVTAAVTVMVPNSLGPAELLLHYGTKEQKEKYLPALAEGREIPCFALTEPEAGSDAGAIRSYGVVEKRALEGKETTGIRLNWDKRYITLSPVATVMGLAFRLYDPAHIIGDKDDVGITVALIPTSIPGIEIGSRHDPLGIPFLNGPIKGKDVFIPLDFIIGGAEQAGHGWRMLMERLSVGRGVSLPALAASSAKLACRATGAYARIREQFHLPIARFEGVEEALGRIAGNAYMIEAARLLTLSAIDGGESPALASAISKYYLTERMRSVVNDAMDVQGGAGISLGPRNFMGRTYQSLPISITVEGSNILTRTLIIFGQGIIRAHPYAFSEMEAAADGDPKRAEADFDRALFGHIGFTAGNVVRTLVSGLTFGFTQPFPFGSAAKGYYRQVGRMASSFALAADVAMLVLGGDLKKKEKLTGRLADVLGGLYISTAALKKFHDDGEPYEDLPLLEWGVEDSLFTMQERLNSFLDNFPVRTVAWMLKFIMFPFGKPYSPPSDVLGGKAASVITAPSTSRDRLTAGIHLSPDPGEPLGRIEDALEKVIAAEQLEKKISRAAKAGELKSSGIEERAKEAAEKGILKESEKETVLAAARARLDVITVDDFPADYWEKKKI